MSVAAAWRWCLAAGLVAFACSWGFGRIPGLVACGDAGGLGSIIAFEFARSPGEVARLFGAEPCRTALIAAQRSGLWLDALGFIPAYTAFLSFAAWAAGGRTRHWIVAALLVAGLSDEIEGMLLTLILDALPGTPALLAALFWAVHLKFLLLALGTAAIAAALVLSLRTIAVGLGLVTGFGAVRALIALFDMPTPELMRGFTLAWVALLCAAATAAVRPSLLAPARRLAAPARPSA